MKICKKCSIPSVYPGADMDKDGVCRLCREYASGRSERKREDKNQRRLSDLESTLRNTRGKGQYDCIIFFSGGKDSIYLLNKIKQEYGMRILAITSGEGEYISEVARKNIKLSLYKLGIDHIETNTDLVFMRKLLKFLFQHQMDEGAVKTISYNLLAIRESFALKMAVALDIPLIMNGFSPGQPDSAIYEYELPKERITGEDWVPEVMCKSGAFSKDELAHYWNPKCYPAGTSFPRLLSPLHAWNYSEDTVVRDIIKAGLISSKNQINPMKSNSRLVWIMMYSDIKNLGYISYMIEFAQIIREGRANRRRWFFLEALARFMIRHKIAFGRNVPILMKELGLSPEDMKINQKDPASVLPQYKLLKRSK